MKRVVHDCSMTQTNRLHTVIYKQTARQKDIQHNIQTDGSTERHTAGYTDRQLDRKTYTHTNRQKCYKKDKEI